MQPRPDGLAQAFLIGADFIGDDTVALVLGDNIFYGVGLGTQLRDATDVEGARVFAYRVSNPSEYGVVEFDDAGCGALDRGEAGRAEEQLRGARAVLLRQRRRRDRPRACDPAPAASSRSPPCTTPTCSRAASPSAVLPRGTAWLDTGTFASLVQAAEFVRVIEDRQGYKVGCPEEIAWRNGWVDDTELAALAEPLTKSGYGTYLKALLQRS